MPALFDVMQENAAQPTLYALSKRNGKAIPAIEAAGICWHCHDGGKSDHFTAYKWLYAALERDRPDIIWTSLTQATLIGQVIGRALGIPVISWQHNAYLKRVNKWMLARRGHASRFWIADSDAVVDFTHNNLGFPMHAIETWPIFRADGNFPPAQVWQSGETVKFASLGRLHVAKGYDILLHSLAKLQNNGFEPAVPFSIDIGGEGSELNRLEALADRNGIRNVNFVGYIDAPLNFISQHHAYLQPSRREGFCIAAHEAIACGAMTIASRVGQLAHTIRSGENGYLVKHENVNDLANTLRTVLSSPQEITRLGKQGREDVLREYSVQAFAIAGGHIMDRARALLTDST